MKPKFDISRLSQEQFEMVLNGLITLKQANPKLEVYLNERFIIKVIQDINNFKNKK